MDSTARFGLPQLNPGQAQKELFHNESLQRIDMLLCPVVEGAEISSPPAEPRAGDCYLIAPGATGAWVGKDGMLAGYTQGGWRFITPVEGVRLFDRSNGQMVVRRGNGWESGIIRGQQLQIDGETVVRGRQPAIANPSAGAVVDGQCRSAVSAILATLRTHGLIE